MNSRRRGFSILELLITLAVIGILAMIAIWNYYSAITRAKQKRTMADIRSIAAAWEDRAGELRAYTAAGAPFTLPAAQLSAGAVSGLLVPTYIRQMPKLDGWDRPYQFFVDTPAGAQAYAIRSAGKDGVFENSYQQGIVQRADCDIVYSGGVFIQYPEGTTE